MLVNNVKQAALNCLVPAAFIIPSKFNYFPRKSARKTLPHVVAAPYRSYIDSNLVATWNSIHIRKYQLFLFPPLKLAIRIFTVQILRHSTRWISKVALRGAESQRKVRRTLRAEV